MVMSSAFLKTSTTNSPKTLFRFLIRECRKLPKGAQEFYRHSIKQNFKQHIDEPDPEYVKQMMEKALADAKWIIEKYKTIPETEKKIK